MTIPSVPTPTTQLDQNTDQLPGIDVTDSAREQLLDAVQKLNDIINQYGGSQMITSANLDTNRIARTNVPNRFEDKQYIQVNAGSALELDTFFVGQECELTLLDNDQGSLNAGGIKNNNSTSPAFLQVYRNNGSDLYSVMTLFDDGHARLTNTINFSYFEVAADGSLNLVPKSGLQAYKSGQPICAGNISSTLFTSQAIAAGASVELTETISGVTSSDIALASPRIDLGSSITWDSWCSSNTAHVRIHNVGNSQVTPPSSTISLQVVKQ